MTETHSASASIRQPVPAGHGSVLATALSGLVALAVAMGIGRFAFTPMLPLMQAEGSLTVTQGGLLAAANYLGYLCGALGAARLSQPPGLLIRYGLAAICVSTLSMTVTGDFSLWLVFRFVAGVASALVLIHVTALSLSRLAAMNASRAGGIVFAGVGTGIAAAGLICLAAMSLHIGAAWSWALLGAAAAAGLAAVWSSFAPGDIAGPSTSATPASDASRRSRWIWILCYGAFGFGYIVPATFLPAMARQALPDPAWFGWVWPVFGAAAALSTLAAARWVAAGSARSLWAASHIVMSIGVIFPLIVTGIAGMVVSALLVGGTFMVATMAAMQHARAIAGGNATPLIAAMTAAFAAGQVLGPLAVSALKHQPDGGLAMALGGSGALLVLSAIVLAIARGETSSPTA